MTRSLTLLVGPVGLVVLGMVAALGTAPVQAAPQHSAHSAHSAHHVRACSAGLVALTFDDGPSSTVTPRLVKTLRRAHVPATFFMVGQRVRTAPAAARLVARSGFKIGNHTWDHRALTSLSDAGIRSELRSTTRALRNAHAHPSHLMRPPYGDIDNRVRGVLRSMHLSPVLWTIDPRDWESGTGPQIAARVLGALRPHQDNLVLQHDGVGNSPNSVNAVPRIIRTARARGYCFTGVGRNGRPTVPVPVGRVAITGGAEHPGGKSTPITVKVVLDRPTSRPVSVLLRTRDWTATAGADYRAQRVRVRFPIGVQKRIVRIKVLNDKAYEKRERLRITFSRTDGMRMHHRHFHAGIRSDDPKPTPPPTQTRTQAPTQAPDPKTTAPADSAAR